MEAVHQSASLSFVSPQWHVSPLFPSLQHLIERSWYAVTETCLAFTVFRDDFSPRFVALFTLLLFLKCFHWLAEDRVDFVSDERERENSSLSCSILYSTHSTGVIVGGQRGRMGHMVCEQTALFDTLQQKILI